MSTTGSPRVKRQRTPGDEELIPGEYTECQTLWFNDGNIVLMAGNIVFRVHQGVISMHSVVLHDMLDVAKPTADGEQYGGLPLVKLHDHADTLAEMLGAMYGRGPT